MRVSFRGHACARIRESRSRVKLGITATTLWLLTTILAQPLLAAPGDLDPSFGVGGKLASDVSPGFEQLDDATLDADGRIVTVGQDIGLFAAVVARYLPDGTLDSSFSGDGVATLDDPFAPEVDSPGGVGIQASGRIIMGFTGGCPFSGLCWIIAGYEVDGDLDPTFGTNGLVSINPPGADAWLTDLVVDANDGITASGYARGGRDFAVARLDEAGFRDPTFGGTGLITTRFANWPWATADSVAIDSRDRVIVGGAVCRTLFGYRCAFAAARFQADGTLDRTFSDNGKTVVRFPHKLGAYARGVTVAPDDKVLLVGEVFVSRQSSSFGTVRLRTNGRSDSTFSLDGKVVTDFVAGRRDGASSIAMQDGRILVGGFAGGLFENGRFAIVRYVPTGRRDTTFGGDGRVTTRFDARAAPDRIEALLVQADGKVIAAGLASIGDFDHDWNELFGVARYLAS